MIRSVIIEDEKNAQDLLQSIIKDYCSDIRVVGTESTLANGIKLINELKPDLVFLDIQLGDSTGFELLEKLEVRNFKLVITTAYDHHALEGFKFEALDYVLKPYSPKRIISAIERVKKAKADEEVFNKLSALLEPQEKHLNKNKISLSTSEGVHLVEHQEIIRLEAQKSYTEVLLRNNTKLLLSKSMGELEKRLPDEHFFRVHSGHLVNVNCVRQMSNKDGGYLVMTDGSQVPLARRRKQDFLAAIQA